MENYNDKSHDAMFSTILSKLLEHGSILKHQDEVLYKIEAQTTKTNGRVSRLEFAITFFKWIFGAAIPLIAGVWEVWVYLHPHK